MLKEFVLILVLLTVFCVVLISIFSIPAAAAATYALVMLIGGILMSSSWKSVEKTRDLLHTADLEMVDKKTGIRRLFGIISQFCFWEFMLALLPVASSSVWCIFFVPAVIIFSFHLGILSDFSELFGVSRKLFWVILLSVQFASFLLGRVVALLLLRCFL